MFQQRRRNNVPHAAIAKIRRLELERAAYEVINGFGLRGLTVEQVARHAGISKGMVHHYFRDKDELIIAAIRHANRRLSNIVRERTKMSKSPSERIWAIISAQLGPELFQPPFWGAYSLVLEGGIRCQEILRVYSAVSARGHSNIAFALRSLVKPREVEAIAHTIWNLLEGAWLLPVAQPELTRAEIVTTIIEYLKNSVPGFDMSVVKLSDK